MRDFQYRLIKICSLAGKEYFHIFPTQPFDKMPGDWQGLIIKAQHTKFVVISFDDCDVTVFVSGRMLIENIPAGCEQRAHAIVKKIIKLWQ